MRFSHGVLSTIGSFGAWAGYPVGTVCEFAVRRPRLGAAWVQARVLRQPPPPLPADADFDDATNPGAAARGRTAGAGGDRPSRLRAARRAMQALRQRVGLGIGQSGAWLIGTLAGARRAPQHTYDAGEEQLVVEVALPAAVSRTLGAKQAGAAAPPPRLELLLRSDFRTCRAAVALHSPAVWLLPLHDASMSRAALHALAQSTPGQGGMQPAGGAAALEESGLASGFPNVLVGGVRWVDLAGGPAAAPPSALLALVALLLAGGRPQAVTGSSAAAPSGEHTPVLAAAGRLQGLMALLRAPVGAGHVWRALATAGGAEARAAGGSLSRRLAAARHRGAWAALGALEPPAALVLLWSSLAGASTLPERGGVPAGLGGGPLTPSKLPELGHVVAAARRAGVLVLVAAPNSGAARELGVEPAVVWHGGNADAALRLWAAVYRALVEQAHM